jgi:hypothetical protein
MQRPLPHRPYPGSSVPFTARGPAWGPAWCQAVTCIVFVELPRRGQRALIGDDVTDNVHGQRRIAKGQKCLPVQPAGVTLVDVFAAGRARRDEGTNRTAFARSQHGSSAHLGGIVGRQAPSTTEVRSGYLTLARAHGSAGGSLLRRSPRRHLPIRPRHRLRPLPQRPHRLDGHSMNLRARPLSQGQSQVKIRYMLFAMSQKPRIKLPRMITWSV